MCLCSIRRGWTVAAFKVIGSNAEQVANAENRHESSEVKDFPAADFEDIVFPMNCRKFLAK